MTELISLSDYFAPLNLITLSYYFLLLIFFDILGTFIKSFIIKQKADNHRLLNWLIGFGFFVFIWFILRFFVPPHQIAILVSIIVLLGFSLPSYVKTRQYKNILSTIWCLKVPFLIIAPFLPAVFVKASLPPYYSDEVAYQFISPSALVSIDTWKFVAKFYQNLPRNFNYFFTLAFSLTKTYAPVRLFHFTILTTAFVFVYQKIKDLINFPAAFLFVFIFFSLPAATILAATVGFVDVATYSFILIASVLLLSFFIDQSINTLILSTLFWALALGSKYTTIAAITSFGLSFVIFIYVYKKNLFKKILTKKILIKVFLVMLVFGGYWYLKNLIAFGNPIYPFFFKCYHYAEICQLQSSKFFGGWTTPITLANLKIIISALFFGNKHLQFAILVVPVLILLNKKKKIKIISLIILVAVFFELFILKFSSGFYARYHQHLELLLLLLLVVQLGNQYRYRFISFFSSFLYILLFISIFRTYVNTVKFTYTKAFLSQQEIDYSLGRINIHDWLAKEFPLVINGIHWCENPPNGERIELVRLDPDMIWYEQSGFMRAFLTNCFINDFSPLDSIPLDRFLYKAKQDNLKFYTVSINSCIPDSQVKIKRHEEIGDDHMLYLRRLNNIIVCNSQEIGPNLYYFNYERL